MLHVALVSAFPTRADAAAAPGTTMTGDAEYLGRWHPPLPGQPERPEVHVFVDDGETAELLERYGWVRA